MAFKMRRYACIDCEEEFNFLHEVKNGVEEPPPNYCPACGAWVGDSPPPLPSQFTTGGLASKSGDAVYRAMERSSEVRMQQAAEASGGDISEFSGLKMTDMKDNMREGDFSMKAPVNDVSKAMDQSRGITGHVGAGSNSQYIADAQKGPYVGAGNAARQGVVQMHQRTAQQAVAAARINKG